MREKIHSSGSIIEPAELIKEATGHFPSSEEFIGYLKDKISDLYEIDISLT